MQTQLNEAGARLAEIRANIEKLTEAANAFESTITGVREFLEKSSTLPAPTGIVSMSVDAEAFNEKALDIARIALDIRDAAKAARIPVVHVHSAAKGGGGAIR